jgi:hypothetical protein
VFAVGFGGGSDDTCGWAEAAVGLPAPGAHAILVFGAAFGCGWESFSGVCGAADATGRWLMGSIPEADAAGNESYQS